MEEHRDPQVRARAIRRCGELLRQIEDKNRERPLKEIHTGNGTNLTRTAAAEAAGLSKRQKDTALRMASILEDDFEEAIESEDLPTMTELAERGTAEKPPVRLSCLPSTLPV